MNARIFLLTIIILLCPGLVQAQFLEPRPEQNAPTPISTDPVFGLTNNGQPEAVGEEVVLRGQVTAFDFVQPRTRISLDTNQGNWQLTAPSAVELRRLGWNSNSLFAGEMVEVQAEREPGNNNIAQIKRITRANGALLLTGLEQEESPGAFADVPDGFYNLDPRQAHLFFSFNHLGFSDTPVKVERLSGTVRWNKDAPESSAIQIDMDVSSLRSGVTVLDEALRGPEFFDFLNHPRMRFSSTSLSISKWGDLTFNGDLEIMGISQPVSLKANITQVGPNPLTQRLTVGISARGEVNRSDWGMTDYLPIIDDSIKIKFEGEFILSGNQGNSDQNGNRIRARPSTNSPSPFNGIPSQPVGSGEPAAANDGDTSTSPSQNSRSIFGE